MHSYKKLTETGLSFHNKLFKTQPANPSFLCQHPSEEYIINKKAPEPLQLVCKTANDVDKVYWYINNKFYKSCPAGEKQFFVPQEGAVKISCTDDKGRNLDIKITVKYIDL